MKCNVHISYGSNVRFENSNVLCCFYLRSFLKKPISISSLKNRADGEKVISSSSGFGEIDREIIEREISNSLSKRQPYVKYSPEEHYKIGKYASENGPIATVRKFQQRFPNMNESTARTSRKRYESDLTDTKRQGKMPSTSFPLKPQASHFFLGK